MLVYWRVMPSLTGKHHSLWLLEVGDKYSQPPEIFGFIHHSRKLISGYSGMFMIYPIMPFVQIYHGGFQIFGGQPQPSIIVNNANYDGYKSLMFPHLVVKPVGNM